MWGASKRREALRMERGPGAGGTDPPLFPAPASPAAGGALRRALSATRRRVRALLPLCKRCRQGSARRGPSPAPNSTACGGDPAAPGAALASEAHRPLPLLARVKRTFSCLRGVCHQRQQVRIRPRRGAPRPPDWSPSGIVLGFSRPSGGGPAPRGSRAAARSLPCPSARLACLRPQSDVSSICVCGSVSGPACCSHLVP